MSCLGEPWHRGDILLARPEQPAQAGQAAEIDNNLAVAIGAIASQLRHVVAFSLATSAQAGAAIHLQPKMSMSRMDEVITMGRKDSLATLRQILINRRDALRSALAGDLSMLKELRHQSSGDVIDAALDSAQDELS